MSRQPLSVPRKPGKYNPDESHYKKLVHCENLTDKPLEILFWLNIQYKPIHWKDDQWKALEAFFPPEIIESMLACRGHYVPVVDNKEIIPPREKMWIEVTHLNHNFAYLDYLKQLRIIEHKNIPTLKNLIKLRSKRPVAE